MKKRLRSPAVLLVATAMVLVAAGIGYAHWSSVTRLEGNVNTGNFEIGWGNAGTNDDGDLYNDPSATDDPTAVMAWSEPGNPTSLDPADWDDLSDRYDKNVGACFAGPDGEVLRVDIHNGYPSYHCSVFAEVMNHGSVPAIPGPTTLVAKKGFTQCDLYDDAGNGPLPVGWDEATGRNFVDFNTDGIKDPGEYYVDYTEFGIFDEFDSPMWEDCYFVETSNMDPASTGHPGEYVFNDGLGDPEFTFHVEEGVLCDPAFQIDPGEAIPVEGWIHLEQGAEQNVTYQIAMETQWINWNEWSTDFCDL